MRHVVLVLVLLLGAGVAGADTALPEAPIRLDAAQRQAIGLTFGTAERRPSEKLVRTTARLDYDERRLALVTLRVSGYIETLFADYTGKRVARGEPLLALYSPELVTAEREYLLARETAARLGGSAVPGARDAAAALVRASRERLRLWEVDAAEIRDLERRGTADVRATVRAPTGGVVIEKMALRGQRVEPGMPLFKIADLSTLWAWADVYEQDLPLVREGLTAELTLPYHPGRTFSARVAWVAPALDPKTRTARVRFDLDNTGEPVLRPEMYGTLSLRVPMGERLVVPESAVLDSGRRQLVFVDGGDGRLVPQPVTLGLRLDGGVEVLDGLAGGERVVTSATFLVDSESKLQSAESMMGMMGALGMGDMQMESARPMEMGGGAAPAEPEERAMGELRVALLPVAPPVVGENPIRIRVRTADGTPAAGLTVRLSYTMDMPGMAIVEAALRETAPGVYEGTARFAMAGPWGVVVEVARPGEAPRREKFTLRVGA